MALQGPLSRDVLEATTGESFADLRYFRRRASSFKVGRKKIGLDVSRTGYTGDLGYELWMPRKQAVAVWDALIKAGQDYGIRPAGMLALDVVRLEAGLILLEVDYTSARHAMNPEQNYSPGEIGLGRLVSLDKADFVGRLALEREARDGGPARRLVGLQLDWYDIEGLFSAQGLPPAICPVVDRAPVPVFAGGRQVGRATSLGWSPILKQAIALASVPPEYEPLGTTVTVEWTVEGRRGRVGATVVELPFLDLPRKTRLTGPADALRQPTATRGGGGPGRAGRRTAVPSGCLTPALGIDREGRIVGDLPGMPVRVREIARGAAPVRERRGLQERGAGGDRRIERGRDRLGRLDVDGQRDPAERRPRLGGECRISGQLIPGEQPDVRVRGPEPGDAAIDGRRPALPPECLVERDRARQVGDAEGHDADPGRDGHRITATARMRRHDGAG